MANPVEQFVIRERVPFEMGGVDLSFTNSSLWMTIAVITTAIFLSVAMKKKEMVPTRLQMSAELLYEFVAKMVRENIGSKGRQYFPFVFTKFVFKIFLFLSFNVAF